MTTPKKVLILAYDFPPYVSVGGLRPAAWYKHFHEFGIEPTVITRQWSNMHGNELDYSSPSQTQSTILEESEKGRIFQTAYRPNFSDRLLLKYGQSKFSLLRRINTAFHEIGQYILPLGTKRGLFKEAQKCLKNEKFDFILATAEPFVLFHYASKLSRSFDIPWVADYRDPWSSNQERNKNGFIGWWNRLQENKCLKNCSRITVPTEVLKHSLPSKAQTLPIEVIMNGFNGEVMKNIDNIEQSSDLFKIGFAGTIYPYHPISSFLKALNQISEEDFEMNFYGVRDRTYLKQLIDLHCPDVKPKINLLPFMENELLLKKLKESNVLVLFNDYSLIGTKIFDYVALKRWILHCFSNDPESQVLKQKHFSNKMLINLPVHAQEEMIKSTNSGISLTDSSALIEELLRLIEVHKEEGQIACSPQNYEQYSRRNSVERLSKLLTEPV